jgi:hypothetical protein
MKITYLKILTLFLSLFFLMACNKSIFKKVDARKVSPDPKERVKKNLEEGRGFRLDDIGKNRGSGNFEFSSSNELWRASLDTIDFMPLLSVDYGGGIIITDWYGEENENDAIKITIQFLSNEVRSDSLNIKIFKRKCTNLTNCKVIQSQSDINQELRVAILKKAAQYKLEDTEKNKKK